MQIETSRQKTGRRKWGMTKPITKAIGTDV